MFPRCSPGCDALKTCGQYCEDMESSCGDLFNLFIYDDDLSAITFIDLPEVNPVGLHQMVSHLEARGVLREDGLGLIEHVMRSLNKYSCSAEVFELSSSAPCSAVKEATDNVPGTCTFHDLEANALLQLDYESAVRKYQQQLKVI